MRYLTRDIPYSRDTHTAHGHTAPPYYRRKAVLWWSASRNARAGRGLLECGVGQRLREESATRSSDLRLFRLAAAPPTPTTLGREYGVSLCLNVQLNALRSCQAHTRVRVAARARLERGGSAQRVWAATLTASLVTRATCSARPEGDSN